MNNIEKEYMPRLVDKQVERYLKVFRAISIEGPKWCGKSYTSIMHSKSLINLAIKTERDKVLLSYNFALKGERPRVIDEWNLVPELWDMVRVECDKSSSKGNYILTCSTKLTDEEERQKRKHSGAGRIGRIFMNTMSLYESGESTGKVSIMDMFNGTQEDDINEDISIEKIAYYIIRGGWPDNIKASKEDADLIPKSYIENILDKDMNDDKKRDKRKMTLLLKSLARNESTISSNQTLLKDIREYNDEESIIASRNTLNDYLDVLERLHIIDNQNAYTSNYRSPERIGKSAKRHFTDPSLACACLSLNEDKLINDIKTFGFLFEALVERDLKIYMNYLNGNLYHFRDNVTGEEIDAILEFEDGEYGAVEVKLGYDKVNEAKKSLQTFYDNMVKKPKFMCIIVGNSNVIAKDKKTGIYIFPITALKP